MGDIEDDGQAAAGLLHDAEAEHIDDDDTQAEQELAEALGISSIPTLMVFRDNVLVYREAGALPAPALDSLITQVRELDMDALKAKIAEEEAAGSQA